MKRKQHFQKKIMFLSTTDNWNPNYPGEKVKLVLGLSDDGTWHLSVWGDDDDGMEIEGIKSYVVAWELYKKLAKIQTVTKAKLKQLGFVQA